MIRVNGLSTLNFVSRPAFRSEENAPEVVKKEYEEKADITGAEALASYNLAIMNNADKLDKIKPIDLIFNPDEEVEGEKIYTSEGKLHSIVKEDENTKTIYTPDEENEDLIAYVDIVDKNTGKLMKSQKNNIDEGKYTGYARVGEFSSQDGKLTGTSRYQDGKLLGTSKFKKYQKGEVSIEKDTEDNKYEIGYYDKKYSLYVELDKNKRPIEFSESKDINSVKHVDTDAYFYNGSLISVRKSETIIIPNAQGIEKLQNPELLPAEKYVPEIDLKGHEGEKSYYSNGAIEKNVIGDTTAYFDINGNLQRVQRGNKEITIDEEEQSIVEDLGDGKTKTTELYYDGSGYVKVSTKDSYSEISFDENKRPSYYSEGVIDENGEEDSKLSLDFNDKGMLTNSWSF